MKTRCDIKDCELNAEFTIRKGCFTLISLCPKHFVFYTKYYSLLRDLKESALKKYKEYSGVNETK